MPRAMWSGVIGDGMISIPIKLNFESRNSCVNLSSKAQAFHVTVAVELTKCRVFGIYLDEHRQTIGIVKLSRLRFLQEPISSTTSSESGKE